MIPKDRPAPGIHGDEESKGSFGVSEPTGDLYLLSRPILKKFEITLVASIVHARHYWRDHPTPDVRTNRDGPP